MDSIITIKNNEDMKNLLKCFEGKNLNFMIGAGASMPFLKDLSLGGDNCFSFEDLLDASIKFNDKLCMDYLSGLFLNNSIINGTYPKINSISKFVANEIKENRPLIYSNYESCYLILKEYRKFMENILSILESNSVSKPKRANIFNTNYDMFVENAIDQISYINHNINFNDGSVGFIKKIVSTQKFYYKISNVGVDDRFEYELPMINLIKLHGSVNWKIGSNSNQLLIDNSLFTNLKIDRSFCPDLSTIMEIDKLEKNNNNIEEVIKEINSLLRSNHNGENIPDYYDKLNSLGIVKPSKNKFSETVFEEHYYQSLRIFVQELERNQTVLIVFGFSFQDEHILSLIKRSLNNPGLMIYVFVYEKKSIEEFKKKFSCYKNIRYVCNGLYFNYDQKKQEVEELKGDYEFFNQCLGAQDYE